VAQAGSQAGGGLERLAASLQRWFRNWTAEGFFQSVGLEESGNPPGARRCSAI